MNLFDFDFLHSAVLKLAALLGSVFILGKYAKSLAGYAKDFIAIPEKIKSIEAETKANGGTSIKDALNRIEKRQLIQEQKTLFILDSFQEFGSFEGDSDGGLTRCSTKFCDLFDKTQDQLTGNNWMNSIAEEDREKIYQEFKRAIEQRRSFVQKFKIFNDIGLITVELRISPITREGSVLNWFGVLRKVY